MSDSRPELACQRGRHECIARESNSSERWLAVQKGKHQLHGQEHPRENKRRERTLNFDECDSPIGNLDAGAWGAAQ